MPAFPEPQVSSSARHSRCQEGYSHSPETGTYIFLVPCVHDGILHLIADIGNIYVKLIGKPEEGKDPGPYILPAPDLPFPGRQIPEQVLFMIDIPDHEDHSCFRKLLYENGNRAK